MKSQNTFRPAILHPASLITLFTISLVLIGLVEYACRTLPNNDDPIFAPKQRRGPTDIQHVYTTTQDYNIFKTIKVVETRLADKHRQIDTQPVVPAPESDVSLAPDLPMTDSEDAIPQTSTLTSCDSCPVFTADRSAYLRIETPTATETPVQTSAPPDGAYLRIDPSTATTSPVPDFTAASSAYLRIETSIATTIPIQTSAPPDSAYLRIDPSTATSMPNSTSPAPNSYLRKQNGHIRSTWEYFQGAYLPTLLSVMFTVPWVILSRETASMEPFYCLASSSGAAAERALTISMISPISPLLAIGSGQWTRLLTVLLAFMSALITPLAPETIGIQTIGKCDHTTAGCTGRIRVFVPGARIIQALLAVMAIFTIIVLVLQRHKKWVSSSNPRSIAALAAALWGTEIRSNLKTLSTATHENQMKQLLEGSRYKFVSETRNDGSTRVCLVSIQKGFQNSTRKNQQSLYPALQNESHIVPVNARRRFSSIAFLLLLIGLTAVILTYHYTSGDTGFENFMSGQGFGVQFLLTGVGVIISFYWRFVFQDIALLVPYSRLAKGNATARESVLLSPPSHPVLSIATAVSARHLVYFVITVVALLSEILPITLATIPFDSGTLYMAYIVSHWTSVAILGVMMIASIMLCFYIEPVLPIKPDSIASNLIYLADSTLSDTFAEICGNEDVSFDKRVEALGLRYALRPSRQEGGVFTVDVDDALQYAPRS